MTGPFLKFLAAAGRHGCGSAGIPEFESSPNGVGDFERFISESRPVASFFVLPRFPPPPTPFCAAGLFVATEQSGRAPALVLITLI